MELFNGKITPITAHSAHPFIILSLANRFFGNGKIQIETNLYSKVILLFNLRLKFSILLHGSVEPRNIYSSLWIVCLRVRNIFDKIFGAIQVVLSSYVRKLKYYCKRLTIVRIKMNTLRPGFELHLGE